MREKGWNTCAPLRWHLHSLKAYEWDWPRKSPVQPLIESPITLLDDTLMVYHKSCNFLCLKSRFTANWALSKKDSFSIKGTLANCRCVLTVCDICAGQTWLSLCESEWGRERGRFTVNLHDASQWSADKRWMSFNFFLTKLINKFTYCLREWQGVNLIDVWEYI